jgi:NADH:ubiquinone oxidoreductase subunit 3 (subunit A)
MENYTIIGFSLFLGAFFVGGAIIASRLLAFSTPHSRRKVQAYECAVDPVGDARIQFKVDYYLFALLFLIFDIESLFLFPCVEIFRSVFAGAHAEISPAIILCELGFFLFILLAGLSYAWRKGILVWEKSD